MPAISFAEEAITIDFKGVDDQQKQNILAHLGSLPSEPGQVNRFLANVPKRSEQAMIALGYNNAIIEMQLNREASPVQATLVVTPGSPTLITELNLKISGKGSEDQGFEEILQRISNNQGQVLNHGQYESWKSDIHNYARNQGYLDGEWVERQLLVNKGQNQASISLHYDSGIRYRLGKITFTGSSLSPEILERLSPLHEDDFYQISQLSKLESALRQSGYFGEIRVIPQIARAEDQRVPIQVKLSDASQHSFQVGVGYVTDTGARAQFNWQTPRVNRHGHSQQTTIRYSTVNPYLNFLYQIPGEDPNNQHYQLRLGLEQNDFGDLTSTLQHGAVIRQDIKGRWIFRTQLRWLSEQWSLEGIDYDGNYLLPGIALSRTRRQGSVRDPSSGFLQSYELEATDDALGSGGRLFRATAFWKWLDSWNNHRLVLRGHLGANITGTDSVEDLAPSLRFFAGGDQSIRGFAYNSLGPSITVDTAEGQDEIVVGGKLLAVASAEYQYYLNDSWRLALFTDAGNAFNRGNFTLKQSVGTGLHWLSPVGAIRVEVAYGFDEDKPRLHISMGAEL
ncbi:autotransporter assembly complex protein TamA [Lacimicrobium alkaliphilum]|uniref:Translocation and assembly module subunit TamA n=2 Tax=Lacimicrobium alkaliphilum TaxID=1526571 RepID=A0ABQ1QX34_9ALTE|nr:autotransporter assembly complex family protein [Lacimicrobium alkaliphilum]GGD49388.1 outer membrane protein assembly factor [Lacimicrobium alkaliphilum]